MVVRRKQFYLSKWKYGGELIMKLNGTYFKDQILYFTKCKTLDEVRENYNLELLDFHGLEECYRISPKTI